MSPCTFLDLFETVEAMERDEGARVMILAGARDPDSHDQLIPYAREMALRQIPPTGAWMAVRMAKRALHKPLLEAVTQTLGRENEGLQQAFGTDDFRETLKARAEKSPLPSRAVSLFNSWPYIFISHLIHECQDFIFRAASIQANASFL
jgi:hypothetical protein